MWVLPVLPVTEFMEMLLAILMNTINCYLTLMLAVDLSVSTVGLETSKS